MLWHWYYIAIWIALGVVYGMSGGFGGWLIMITDKRNTFHTWMAFPSLILCWIFWPIGGWLSRMLFYMCLIMNSWTLRNR